MTVLILSSLGFTFCFVIPLMAQPLSLGFCIMMLTLLMCMFILFLIYVGGLLVMFAYVAALIPNILMHTTKMFLFYWYKEVSYF